MSNPSTAVAKTNVQTIQQLMVKHKDQISAALPKHMTADRMARIALTEIRRNPKLQECDPLSLFAGVIQSSQLGLELGLLGEAYLIPYGREARFQPGYQGLVKLARNTGLIKSIYAHCVFANDVFEIEYGIDERLKHVPVLTGDKGEKIGAYAYASLKDGAYQFLFMNLPDIFSIRDKHSETYKAYKANKIRSCTWVESEDAMCKKTVIIQLLKMLPKSPEVARLMELEYTSDQASRQGLSEDLFGDDAIDVDPVKRATEQRKEDLKGRLREAKDKQESTPVEMAPDPCPEGGPMAGDAPMAEYCGKCAMRDGCPVWPEKE